jgi:hypothetical protein
MTCTCQCSLAFAGLARSVSPLVWFDTQIGHLTYTVTLSWSFHTSSVPRHPFVARAAAANVNPHAAESHDKVPLFSQVMIGAPMNDAV